MNHNFTELFTNVRDISERYGLDRSRIDAALAELPDFRVTVPVVGGFSTGKSSLINAVLGEDLLATKISAETAVPTEIISGNDTVTLITEQDGQERKETIPLSAFDSAILSASTYSLVQIETSNEFFRQIPSVRLVDMPGFDSGIEAHNRAIDQYLPKSLAYILTVAAEEGTLRESIITFLNELKLYKMPVYAVITKSQKVLPEQMEETKAHITDTIQRFLGVADIKIAVTNAKGKEIMVDGFQEMLLELQGQSQAIYEKTFSERLDRVCIEVEKYLRDRLNQSDLSLEELRLEKEQLEQNLAGLTAQFEEEKAKFSEQLAQCIALIQNKITQDLNASANTLESMLLQGTDVSDKINHIIRNAVTSGIQTELEPRLQKYLREVSELIQATIYGDTVIRLDSTTLQTDEEVGNALQAVLIPVASLVADVAFTALASTSIATALGLTGSVLGPIGALVGALAGTLISASINKGKAEKQERERQELARQKVREIIESVSMEAGSQVEVAITGQIAQINEQIQADIEHEKSLLEKSLQDTEEELQQGTQKKEQDKQMLQDDLKKIQEIRNGIQ